MEARSNRKGALSKAEVEKAFERVRGILLAALKERNLAVSTASDRQAEAERLGNELGSSRAVAHGLSRELAKLRELLEQISKQKETWQRDCVKAENEHHKDQNAYDWFIPVLAQLARLDDVDVASFLFTAANAEMPPRIMYRVGNVQAKQTYWGNQSGEDTLQLTVPGSSFSLSFLTDSNGLDEEQLERVTRNFFPHILETSPPPPDVTDETPETRGGVLQVLRAVTELANAVD